MNKFFNRPVAPHLTIYLPQSSSLFSIWHRIAAIFLLFSIYSYFFIQKFLLWTPYSSFPYNAIYLFDLLTISYISFLIYLFFFYHVLNGLRHITSNLNLWFSNKAIQVSNIILIFSIIILLTLFNKNFYT